TSHQNPSPNLTLILTSGHNRTTPDWYPVQHLRQESSCTAATLVDEQVPYHSSATYAGGGILHAIRLPMLNENGSGGTYAVNSAFDRRATPHMLLTQLLAEMQSRLLIPSDYPG
ncbi:hypothetical protein R6Q59_013717, partial [Mikania micrantha]